MALDIDGGNFTSGVYGGIITTPFVYQSQFGISGQFLYRTGNMIYEFDQRDIDSYVDTITGYEYPFYKIIVTGYGINSPNVVNFVNCFSTGNATSFYSDSGIFYVTLNEEIQLGASGLSSGVNYCTVNPNLSSGTRARIKNTYTYYPDTFNASQHLLIVYNSGNADSISLKNYYTGLRTGLSGANILGLTGFTFDLGPFSPTPECVSLENAYRQVINPIVDWIATSNKPIRYVVLMYDLPTRITTDIEGYSPNFCHFLSQSFSGSGSMYSIPTGNRKYLAKNTFSWIDQANSDIALNSLFKPHSGYRKEVNSITYDIDNFSLSKYLSPYICTHITASGAVDVSGYIRKICEGRVSGHYLLSPYTNSTNLFMFLPANASGVHQQGSFGEWYKLTGINGLNHKIRLTGDWPNNGIGTMITGSNLAGFGFYATHSLGLVPVQGIFNPTYSHDGDVIFSGNKNWYIMTTIESFNAQMGPLSLQGSVFDWMRSGAFGGTGWENCPVGAVGTTSEPNDGTTKIYYITTWFSGYPFIECANVGMPYLNAAFGDPFVKLR